MQNRYSANFEIKINSGKLLIDGIFAKETNLRKVKKWKITNQKIIVYGQ